MSELSARDHALRVAVLKIVSDETVKLYKTARDAAGECFAPLRGDGQSQQKALLPDGTDIGLISIKDGGTEVTMIEGADLGKTLEAWADDHLPGAWEERADESALTDAEVLDVLKAVFPHLVSKRLRPATRAALLKEIEDSGGFLTDHATGERVQVADVGDGKPTGDFSFRPAKGAREKVIAAWQSGDLRHLGLAAIAIPAGPEADPWAAAKDADPWTAPDPAEVPNGGLGPFGDEFGFYDPEKAAAHAVIVQGGYSTPPREAYRMIRGGGTGAERARDWLAKHGLDPENPREGQDTPWPLPEAGEPGA